MNINDLNDGQKKIYQEVISFLFDPSEQSIIIQGSAGTGKSFLLQYLITEGIEAYKSTCRALNIPQEFQNFHVTATTNKAAYNLSRLGIVNGINALNDVKTLATYLGLYLRYDSKTHKQVLVPNGMGTIKNKAVVFVDECSMISSDLFKYVQEKLPHCKIIYIGDKYQLPPVKEKVSPIYNCNYRELTLTEPMRNAGNPHLIKLCEQLKETCETGIWKDIHSVPGSIEVIKSGAIWQATIDNNFNTSCADKRILAYSNNLVTSYLEYLSELRNEPEYLAPNTWYVSNASYRIDTGHRWRSLPIESPVKILEVSDEIPDKIYTYYQLDPKNDFERGLLRHVKLITPVFGCIWTAYVFAKPEIYNKYMKELYKCNPPKYYDVRDQTLDLRKTDVSTVHKAQGSTLDTVFIDLDDISKCTQKEVTAKLLYVAASRAKNKVVFFGELAKRYGVKVE